MFVISITFLVNYFVEMVIVEELGNLLNFIVVHFSASGEIVCFHFWSIVWFAAQIRPQQCTTERVAGIQNMVEDLHLAFKLK